MPKTKTPTDGHDGPSGSASKKVRNSETTISPGPVGLKNTLHGNAFQLKLLMLFLIKGIGVSYQFQLGTEIPGMGGKFDDLIFKYEIEKADGTNAKTVRYRFLQAKHKQNEEKEITAAHLRNNSGDFSLPKYFHSYCHEIKKHCSAENVRDCIICTNIGFGDKKAITKLEEDGFQLIPYNDPPNDPDKILVFDPITNEESGITIKTPARYKLNITNKLRQEMKKWSEVHLLATTLLKNVSVKLELKCGVFKKYHLDLVNKWEVIEREEKNKELSGKLSEKFMNGKDLTGNVKEFRQILSDLTFEKMKNKETKDSAEVRESVFQEFWSKKSFKLSKDFGMKNQSSDKTKESLDCISDEDITHFLDKLVFAVHTPNEVKLDPILKGEMGKYYKLHEIDFQSDFVLRNMLDWFKKKESTFMSSEEGKNILNEGKQKMESLRVTGISIDYQKKLKEALEFNDKAIGEMKEKLMQLLTSPNKNGRITTSLPKRTTVKVIGALEKLMLEEPNTNNELLKEYFQYEDNYLVMSSSRLKNNPFKFESNNSHNLLVVVCENGPSKEIDEFCQQLVNEIPKKRVIIISQDKGDVEDELNFSDLSVNFQLALLEKEIEFQGLKQSVKNLIKRIDTTGDSLVKNGDVKNSDAGKILDFNSIEELIKGEQIKIPLGSSAHFEQNLYIKRQLEFPLDLANFNHFYDQLAKKMKCEKEKLEKECAVDPQENIKWYVEGERKKKIWEEMKKIVKENSKNSPSSNDGATPKKNLITKENRQRKVFILNGIAGTGKSTILSNYYEKIKEKNPDTWVIRIDLLDYSKELKLSHVNRGNAIEFFVNLFAKKSPFARSLLTHRFKTDGRIVVMLDGFDEIGDEKREKVFQFITAIKLTNIDALYLTTRSHLKEELRDKLFQFYYPLKKFRENGPIDCLSKYWTNKLEMLDNVQKESIQSFGEKLVTRLSTTLKDKEKDFIGIPLHCRMLAEIYENQLINTIRQGSSIDILIEKISKEDLDLTSLYSDFMKKKFEIYVSQKLKIALNTMECTKNKLEEYMRNLAIKKIVISSDDVDVLLGKSKSFQSRKEMMIEEKNFTDAGVCWGYLGKDDKGEMIFLHQTYAEYLFAKYLHAGFLPEEDENYTELLTLQPVRKLIFRTIFMDEKYEGVRMFFNSFLFKLKMEPTANLSREIEQSYGILGVAIRDQNAYLFTFLCDCLDQSQDVGVARKKAVEDIVQEMFRMQLKNISESEPNQEEMTKIIERVIKFLVLNREMTKKFLNNNEGNTNPYGIVNALLFNECYSRNLKPFLELLSSVYCEDTEFKDFLLKTITEYKRNNSRGNPEKTFLTILRDDLGRNDVVNEISHQISCMDA